jgi:hypothetical protein
MNKAMEVCTICGSFLIVGDVQTRLDEHTSGKQHAGYAKIRTSLEEVIVSLYETKNFSRVLKICYEYRN